MATIAITAWHLTQRPSRVAAAEATRRKDHRSALRLALDDLTAHPGDPQSSLIAARSFSALVYGAEAEPYYAVASAAGLMTAADEAARIDGLIVSNRPAEAARVCREELARRPDDVAVLTRLATVEWISGRSQEAQEAAERLARTAEGKADGLALLATVHHDARRREQAVAACEALLAIDPELKTYRPGPAIFWREFIEDLIAIHRDSEAIDHLRRVITPYTAPELNDLLGSASLALGDVVGAESAWRESARRDPSRINPWLQLGRLEVGRKRYTDAVDVLDRALRLEPDRSDVHFLLSTAHRMLGHAEDAKRFADRAEALKRGNPQVGGMGANP